MNSSPLSPSKIPYRSPRFEVYGDIRAVTQTAAPSQNCDQTIASCSNGNYHSSAHTGNK